LIQDAAGILYGTTTQGGPYPLGVVFKLSPSGTETVLHSFTGGGDGSGPFAPLILDAAGSLYGTTSNGGGSSQCLNGCGTVFRLSLTGTETILYSFTGGADGNEPRAGLVWDPAGDLYSTTIDDAETVLHSFTGGADGREPLYAGLVRDAAGNLYGTTWFGGSPDQGVVFKLSPSGTETILHTFTGADGAQPIAGLIQDAAGNLYGTTSKGGAYGHGVVFRLTP
jgi:uncharacterized repeat protein (TIGR03803 family)